MGDRMAFQDASRGALVREEEAVFESEVLKCSLGVAHISVSSGRTYEMPRKTGTKLHRLPTRICRGKSFLTQEAGIFEVVI